MKCIVIFEDKKGFTKIVEFARFPSQYRFPQYEGIKVVKYGTPTTPTTPTTISHTSREITFIPYGLRTEVGGQIIQTYRSI